jgi:hypothetical protein
MTLPAIPAEFLIQLRVCCGFRSYAVAGKPRHECGICGWHVPDSGEPWEIYAPDVTPRRPE